jgi:hypothetical protein
VLLEARPDLRVAAFGYAYFMLAGPGGLAGFFFNFYEFVGLGMTNGAFCGGSVAFVDISTHEASESLFHSVVNKWFVTNIDKFPENH